MSQTSQDRPALRRTALGVLACCFLLNMFGRGMGDTYNITVNGALDAEGVSRQIVSLLNNSYYRGTGGATALVV